MGVRYWLYLFLFIFITSLSGLLVHLIDLNKMDPLTICRDGDIEVHPFLCGQRIAIGHASITELSMVKGISKKRAKQIHSYLREHAHVEVDDLIEIKGIGQATIGRLKQMFF